jgi:hypothetical protein
VSSRCMALRALCAAAAATVNAIQYQGSMLTGVGYA